MSGTTTGPPAAPSSQMLWDLSWNLHNFENAAAQTVEQQQGVATVLGQEMSYLQGRQKLIQDSETTTERTVAFNQNFSKRFVEYIKMVVILVVGLGMMVFIVVLTKMEALSSTWGTILSILVVGGCAIWAYSIYIKMLARDNMNYDRIHTDPPPESAFNSGMGAGGGKGVGAAAVCIGEQCCKADTTWNLDTNACIAKPTTTTIAAAAPAPAPAAPKATGTTTTSTTTGGTTTQGFTNFIRYEPFDPVTPPATTPDPKKPLFDTQANAPSTRANMSSWVNASNDKYAVLDKAVSNDSKAAAATGGVAPTPTPSSTNSSTHMDVSGAHTLPGGWGLDPSGNPPTSSAIASFFKSTAPPQAPSHPTTASKPVEPFTSFSGTAYTPIV